MVAAPPGLLRAAWAAVGASADPYRLGATDRADHGLGLAARGQQSSELTGIYTHALCIAHSRRLRCLLVNGIVRLVQALFEHPNLRNQRREPWALQALMLEGPLLFPRTVIGEPRFSTRFGWRCRDR